MPRLITRFNIEVSVPQWEYCNEQKDNDSKGSYYCNFHKGSRDERYCVLFNKPLYSSYDWVRKCEECTVECGSN